MTSSRKYYVTFICLLLLMAGMYSCQKEEREDTLKKGLSGKKDPDNRVADLLASMNMHHFTDPVKAPDFELNSVHGEKISLSQYRGKVVLLSFWATW